MTKITSVYRMLDADGEQKDGGGGGTDDPSGTSTSSMPGGFEFERRQLPMAVSADRKITMVIDLRPRGLSYDHNILRARELDDFASKYHILTAEERRASLTCTRAEFVAILSQSVPCVGCRRSVERLYDQLQRSGHPTLEPVQITSGGVLTVVAADMAKPPVVAAMLHKHQPLLNALLENQPRNKKSSRCTLHTLDSFRSRPFSDMWREVWGCMKQECREEMTQISTVDLHRTLDAYLKKHKFCQECRTKVEKAYGLLLTDRNPNKEKGYVAALYANIKKCIPNKHIHLRTKTEFIDSLIRRAEPELNGSNTRQRERHAKTLEIAQEEVLTCIGMFIYERLRRVHLCLKEEENAVQVLAACAAHTLCRSFDMAVEKKRGISNLELLYQEISRAERAKKVRQELKKLKKKQKKGDKQQMLLQQQQQQQMAGEIGFDDDEEEEEDEDDSMVDVCQICDGNSAALTTTDGGGGACSCEATSVDEQGYDTEEQDTSSICCSEFADALEGKSVDSLGVVDDDDERDMDECCGGGYENALVSATNSVEDECSCSDGQPLSGNKPKKNKNKKRSNKHVSSDLAAKLAVGNGGLCLDAGYGSETTHSLVSSRTHSQTSSRNGSEVACSDGFCNHSDGEIAADRVAGESHHQLTLQQMLDDSAADSDEEHACSKIPDAVLLDFAERQQNIKALREQLRQDLRHRFAAMCVKVTGAQNA